MIAECDGCSLMSNPDGSVSIELWNEKGRSDRFMIRIPADIAKANAGALKRWGTRD